MNESNGKRSNVSENLQKWQEFLTNYSKGEYPADQIPPPPPLITSPLDELSEPCFDDYRRTPVYDSVNIDAESARKVRNFYSKHGFLPPPRSSTEPLREQCILEYDLYSDTQMDNIRSVIDLVHSFFGGIVTFTLFRDANQSFEAVAGDEEVLKSVGLLAGMNVLPETSLCGHAVLWSDQNLYINSLRDDWRYKSNPYTAGDSGIKSYVGSVVTLEIDPTQSESKDRVAIGVINVMQIDRHFPAKLAPKEEKVLRNLTKMLESQLRATWDGNGRIRAARARAAVSELIDRALVSAVSEKNAQIQEVIGSSEPTTPVARTHRMDVDRTSRNRSTSNSKPVKMNAASPFGPHARIACDQILTVLSQAESVLVIDLRSVIATKLHGDIKYTLDSDNELSDSECKMQIIAGSSRHDRPYHVEVYPAYGQTLLTYISQHGASSDRPTFTSGNPSGLERILAPQTVNHAAITFFAGIDPLFCVVITSEISSYAISNEDLGFVRSMGAVLRAQILQRRVLEADAVKTTVLSSISHELRTPLHGILSSLELANRALETNSIDEIKGFLDVVNVSAQALDGILNDVLDFSRLSQGSEQAVVETVDIERLVRDTILVCLTGREEPPKVDVILEVEGRDWAIDVDRSKLQRVVMNGLSNAMKHTTKGSISIKLSAMKDPSRIALAVQDTGHGMSKEFLRRAFKPFAKADSFTTGMGLGLYLVKVMIEDMHGKVDLTSSLGVGTTLAITLPTNLKDSGRGKASIKRDVMHSASDPERRNRRGSDQVMESPREEKQQAVASQTLQPIRKSIRALVVDDNEISRKILVVLLTKQKTCRVEIETAVDGEDGLAKFATFAPHIVLTDVSMPKMDGVTLAQEIRKVEEQDRTRRRSKIYALTGLGSSDPRLKHLALTGNAALDGWFVKGKNKLADIAELVQQVAQST